MMNRIRRWSAAFLACAMVLALSGCSYFLPQEQGQLEVPITLDSAVNYTTVQVERGDLVKELTMSARFSAVEQHDAFFKVGGGRIEKIHVSQGTTVREGDVLMELNNDDAVYNLEKAKLNLEIQKLNLENTRRYQGANSLAYKTGELNLQIAQMEVERLTQQAEANVLYAPVSGEVIFAKDDMAVGDTVLAYDPLFTIADTSELHLVCSDPQANLLVVGMDAKITLRARGFTGVSAPGRVMQSPADSPTDATSKAIIVFDYELTPAQKIQLFGREATVTVELESRGDVLYLPTDVINTNGVNKYVRVLEADNSVVEKSVTLGLTINNKVEIIDGVEEGEVVILK